MSREQIAIFITLNGKTYSASFETEAERQKKLQAEEKAFDEYVAALSIN